MVVGPWPFVTIGKLPPSKLIGSVPKPWCVAGARSMVGKGLGGVGPCQNCPPPPPPPPVRPIWKPTSLALLELASEPPKEIRNDSSVTTPCVGGITAAIETL